MKINLYMLPPNNQPKSIPQNTQPQEFWIKNKYEVLKIARITEGGQSKPESKNDHERFSTYYVFLL